MIINDITIYKRATNILKSIYGKDAVFREGQYEAIEAVLTKKRTLVVQKTGWGKSLVYFIAAKMMKGTAIVVSPLLVLMDNQQEAADRIGLNCVTLNSNTNKEERPELLDKIKKGQFEIVFTTPETLYSDDVQGIVNELDIGLFVVDECHCISDWGHDFRLEYGKLNRIIKILSQKGNVSVLGTTATANDRVIDDLIKQFGEDVYISRGPLTRDSLHIEILRLETRAERYAWLKENLAKLPGTGIIYCLTQRDCENLSRFLNENGYSTRPYHSGKNLKEMIPDIEIEFHNNKIKAVVATIKLGMGYDKGDIGFVIHFQRPSSLVAYYQQIGRAGRKEGIEAYCYMMTGKEDKEINEYFIEDAFPTEEQERAIIKALEKSQSGMTLSELCAHSNISGKALNKSIMFLLNQQYIYQDTDTKKYNRSPKYYVYQGEHYEAVKKQKREDMDALDKYVDWKGCLSKYVVRSLNDDTAYDCGKCANCLGHGILEGIILPSSSDINAIQDYLGTMYFEIEPRKRWQEKNNPFDKNTIISDPNETGLALAKYGDAGYGEMVQYDKYKSSEFREELVEKAAAVLLEKIGDGNYSVVTNIPSNRNLKVKILAQKIALSLGYEYRELLEVSGMGDQQKSMHNTFFQYRNAKEKIRIKGDIDIQGGTNIVLIDDLVDSKWTLTVAGRLLKLAGAGKVFPFCLADSSNKEG